jgi:hypothetical protein
MRVKLFFRLSNWITIFCLFFQNGGKLLNAQEFNSSNIPIIIIDTYGEEILDTQRINAQMTVIWDEFGGQNNLNDTTYNYNGRISIELRGSFSQKLPKKQFGLETQNEDGSNNNVSLLGLPAENDWVLYAPYSDKSLMRNVLLYTLAGSFVEYAPRTRFCELILNEEYMGVFVLIEKIKKDKNRVNISTLNPDEISGDDITGGYILKIDRYSGSSCYPFYTQISGTPIQYHYPNCDEISFEQKNYIKNYVQNFEDALFSVVFLDSVLGYKQFVNLGTLVDFFVLNEISKNIDGYRLSTFMYKDKDSKGGKLCYGPVWDFNLAFGNADYLAGFTTEDFIASRNNWWSRLLEDSVFTSEIFSKWIKLRESQLSNTVVLSTIDSLVEIIKIPQERNFDKWEILGKKIWPNFFVGSTFEEEILFLKAWIINRLNWMDNNIPGNEKTYLFADYKNFVFPNPFDYFFTYVFEIEKEAVVTLKLYDITGSLITDIIHETKYVAGKHNTTWNSFINESLINNSFYILELIINGVPVSHTKLVKRF